MPVGEALAETRRRAGLTIAEVSQRTRIREEIIRDIEGDDYSGCGGDFYARGSIRSIAAAVGADPEPLISEYDAAHRAPDVLSAVSLEELLAPAQARGRDRRSWIAVLGLALVVALGIAGYAVFTASPHATSTPPAAANHAGTRTGRGRTPPEPKPSQAAPATHPALPARAPMRPAATVRAYITAINRHHYARAWRLGGRNTGGSYPGFVNGFTGTAQDTLTIVSVSGDVVTARLSALQADGSVNAYQGTYTVHHGVIVGFDVVQVG